MLRSVMSRVGMPRAALSAKRGQRRVLWGCLALVLAFGAASAHAEDDDEDLTFEQKLMRNLLGGVLGTGPGIDYRERAPLVVPPSRDLPPPEPGTAAINNPAWPVDADVKRRKEERKRSREARRFHSDNEDGRALRPDELELGRKAGAGRVTPGRALTEDEAARPLSPSALGYKGGLFSNLFGGGGEEKPAVFAGEPERSSLIEPPPGYRTPSPAQPYGLAKEKYVPQAVKPEDIAVGR